MKQLIPIAFICSLIFMACGERSVGSSKAAPEAPVTPYVTPTSPASGVATALPTANPAQAATNTAAAVAKINPAHGQPGHRCDIAVGAAIPEGSAAPAQSSAPAGISPVLNPTATPVAAPASTAGLNPAHGQPGHRCDIPVGSPLSAKPAGK